MTHPNFDKKSRTRGASTPSPSTGEETSMAAPQDNIPIGEKIAERETLRAPERIGWAHDPDAVNRLRLEMGVSPLEIAAEQLECARPDLRDAMKLLDCTEHRALHLRLGNLINDLDDFRALLMERCS